MNHESVNDIRLVQHQLVPTGLNQYRPIEVCCDGSKRSVPALHGITSTYSSCVEQPIQRLFFALITTLKGYLIYGGDAKDAYAHSPPPSVPTFVSIDDQYADWYEWKFGTKLDRKKVLPVQHALQGHPESGKLWERTINKVLRCSRLNFQTTVHDRTVYWTTFRGVKVYLLRQVDDFALASPSEDIAKEIFQIIGEELKFAKEDKIPLEYLGLLDDFNGVKVQQSAENVVLSSEGYIERVLRTHEWETPSRADPSPNRCVPFSPDTLTQIYKDFDPQ